MFSEKNMKRLTFILLGLFIIAIAFKFKGKFSKSTSSKTNEIVAINIGDVQTISFYPENNGEKYKIKKEKNYWLIKTGNKEVQADAYTVHELLNQLKLLKPQKLISKSKKEWEKYKVTETLGTRIVINEDTKPIADIILGKFEFDKSTNKITSYVRNTKEKQVYAVEGYLSMMFTRGANSLRDNAVLLGNPEKWNKLTFKHPTNKSFTLTRTANGWSCNSKACSTDKVNEYFSKIRMLTTSKFEEALTVSNSKQADYQLTIEGNGFKPIIIECFHINDIFVTRSSINQNNLFNSNTIKNTLFVKKEMFF